MKTFTRICVAPFVALSVLFSCIGSEEDMDSVTNKILSEDTTSNEVDSGYIVPRTCFIGEWLGSYKGYDARQDTVCWIKRRVEFKGNNEYESIVWGYFGIVDDGDEEYALFERETGTFEYNEVTGIVTYYVTCDSVINYSTQRLDSFPGKKVEGVGVFMDYQEHVYFSVSKDGQRRWIRKDDNLYSEEDHNILLFYPMNKSH